MPYITENQLRITVWKSALGKRQSAIAFVVAASFATIIPAILWGIPSNLDLTNHFRFALPFYDGIATGDFYPGWLAESNHGYGDPSFRFYPPALYYLLAAARFVIGNWYGATLVVYVVISITGGLGMYFWSRSILSSTGARWTAFFYALAPYHLNQLYQATLLAEWMGSAILPIAFGLVERICAGGQRRYVVGLGAVYALLILTHLPLSVIGSLALLAYGLVRVERKDRLLTLGKLGAAAVMGLCVSATYWVTMVSEMRWIRINEVNPDASVDYRLNFILSTLSPNNLNVWWMNIILLLTVLLFAPLVLLPIARKAGVSISKPVLVLGALSLFMALPLSRPIWDLLAPLQQTQFPWRWLAIVSMGGSVLAACGLQQMLKLHQGWSRVGRLLILGAMAASIAFSLSHIIREAQFLPQSKFENSLNAVRGSTSVNYWFPIWARSNPRPMTNQVEAPDRSVSIEVWQAEHREFRVSAGEPTAVRVQTFYYPHWIATSEGVQLPTRPDNDGALLISVPPTASSVKLDFLEPTRSRVSSLASLVGLFLMLFLSVPTFRSEHK